MVFFGLHDHLFVVELLQFRQCVNALLPGTFLRVGQNVGVDLEGQTERC